MLLNDKQTPDSRPDGLSSNHPRQMQTPPVLDDDADDPAASEGYLPEIYFLLKSENPADW